MLRDSGLLAIHAKYVTVMDKDIKLLKKLKENKYLNKIN